MKVLWSKTAENRYFEIIEHLYKKWGSKSVEKFEQQIANIESKLISGILIFPKSKKSQYEKCVVNRQNSLVFQRFEDHIKIIALIDNRSDHPY